MAETPDHPDDGTGVRTAGPAADDAAAGDEGWGDDGWDDEGWDDDGWDDEDDYVYVPEEPSLFRRLATLGVVLFVLIAVVLGAGAWWVRGKLDPSGPKTPVELTIPPDATTSQIANQLEELEVVSDATVFRYYVKWQSAGPFQAGDYDGLTTNQAMGSVVDRLEAGPLPPDFTQITFPEGLWLSDVRSLMLETYPQMSPEEIQVVVGDQFTPGSVRSAYQPDGKPLEGFLFPATYQVSDDDRGDEAKLVQQMVDTFDRTADEVGLADAPARLAGQVGELELTPYEVLIVASIIEEEAGTPADKPKIARVVYNRLLRNMTLGIDATVLYAIGEHKETLTQSDLQVDSPYNTRLYRGLPPTPIASPGRESIEAALNPEDGNWLYYVLVDEEGNHFFTNDFDEFNRVAEESRQKGLFE